MLYEDALDLYSLWYNDIATLNLIQYANSEWSVIKCGHFPNEQVSASLWSADVPDFPKTMSTSENSKIYHHTLKYFHHTHIVCWNNSLRQFCPFDVVQPQMVIHWGVGNPSIVQMISLYRNRQRTHQWSGSLVSIRWYHRSPCHSDCRLLS